MTFYTSVRLKGFKLKIFWTMLCPNLFKDKDTFTLSHLAFVFLDCSKNMEVHETH